MRQPGRSDSESEQKRTCSFCTRKFRSDADIDAMRQHLRKKLLSLPNVITKVEAELEEVRAEIDVMEACRAGVAEINHLREDLPRDERELGAAEARHRATRDELPGMVAKLEAVQSQVASLEVVLSDAEVFEQTWNEYESCCREAQEVRRCLSASPSSVEACEARVREVKAAIRALNVGDLQSSLESALRRRRSLTEARQAAVVAKAKLEQEIVSLQQSEVALRELPPDTASKEIDKLRVEDETTSAAVTLALEEVARCQDRFK